MHGPTFHPFSFLGLAIGELIGFSTGYNLKGPERTKPYHDHPKSEVSPCHIPAVSGLHFICLVYVT